MEQNAFLLTQYANLKDWLKHAEAKNAILLSLCSVGVFNLAQLAEKQVEVFDRQLILVGLLIPMSLGLIAALLSLFPQLSVVKYLGRASQSRNLPASEQFRPGKSLIYFGDLLNLKSEEYLNQLRERGGLAGEEPFSPMEEDLAQQIVILAQITQRKFAMFEFGVRAMLISAPLFSLVFVVFSFLLKHG